MTAVKKKRAHSRQRNGQHKDQFTRGVFPLREGRIGRRSTSQKENSFLEEEGYARRGTPRGRGPPKTERTWTDVFTRKQLNRRSAQTTTPEEDFLDPSPHTQSSYPIHKPLLPHSYLLILPLRVPVQQ